MCVGFKRFLTAVLLVFTMAAPAAGASLIRDAEIEYTLRGYSEPVFGAAGLAPSSVKIFIIEEPTVNAFVAGGSNIFLHTGLILESETPEMLIGVIAHEAGHIAGGHLAQGAEQLKNAQIGTVLSYILGAAAAVGGASEAGAAIISAGQHASTQNFLAYNRSQEQAADTAALSYLDKTGTSAEGLLSLLEKMRQSEHRHYGQTPPYAMTHPLSIDRIAHVRSHLMQGEALPGEATDAAVREAQHRRLLAKLTGFLKSPESTLQRYPEDDHSLEARYARAIALYRLPDTPAALTAIDALISDYPSDPFFYELKGQVLFEDGQIEPAILAYEKAVSLLPDAALILTELARAKLAAPTDARLREAIAHLRRSAVLESTYSPSWHLLAVAYGKVGDLGMSRLAMAEEALLKNQPEEALKDVEEATKLLEKESPAALRADDVKRLAQTMLKENKGKRR